MPGIFQVDEALGLLLPGAHELLGMALVVDGGIVESHRQQRKNAVGLPLTVRLRLSAHALAMALHVAAPRINDIARERVPSSQRLERSRIMARGPSTAAATRAAVARHVGRKRQRAQAQRRVS